MSFDPATLTGRYVRLEPLVERHREMLRPAAQNPRIWVLTTSAFGAAFDPYFDAALKRAEAGIERPYAVRLLEEDRLVGSTRFMNIEAAHRRLEIGATWYDPTVWSGMVNPECKLLLMSHVFETLRWNRVEYKTDARNQRSRDAILRLGATQEGIFRKHMVLADGHVRDSVYFSIVDDEWPEVKAGLERRLKY
ncbi:MAG: GNAT family N-acetyltransferase [Reyranellaceae bacterium]